MSSSSYIRWCTVCQKGYNSDFEWLNHLLLKSHQDEVASESGTWEKETLECCVVAFAADFPKRIPNRAVLKYFSDLGCGLVTDFVCHLDKRNVVIVQFESRTKVDKLFALMGMKCSEALVDNQLLQLRRLTDYLTLERECFFPGIGRSRHEDIPQSLSPPPKKETLSFSPPLSYNLTSQLVTDFTEIRNATQISTNTFQTVMELMKNLQRILEKHIPGCKLYLFRHWYLKLLSPGTNQLLIYLQNDKLLELNLREKDYTKIFQQADSLRILPNVTPLKNPSAEKISPMEPHGVTFQDHDTGIIFSLCDFRYLSTEMQTCQLLKHMLSTSDQVLAARALIMMVFYWASVNSIPFERSALYVTLSSLPYLAPIPAALEWLIIFFLTKRKLVPTVKQVMEENLFDRHLESRLSHPGFPMKPDFVDPFLKIDLPVKNVDFDVSVLRLAEQFFSFYGDHLQNEKSALCILNTRDGQVIMAEKGSSESQGDPFCFHFKGTDSKLGEDEKQVLSADTFLKSIAQDIHRQKAAGVKVPVCILHPLHVANRLPLDALKLAETWTKMRETANRLRQLLKTLEPGADPEDCPNREQFSLKQVLNLGAAAAQNNGDRGATRKRKRTVK